MPKNRPNVSESSNRERRLTKLQALQEKNKELQNRIDELKNEIKRLKGLSEKSTPEDEAKINKRCPKCKKASLKEITISHRGGTFKMVSCSDKLCDYRTKPSKAK